MRLPSQLPIKTFRGALLTLLAISASSAIGQRVTAQQLVNEVAANEWKADEEDTGLWKNSARIVKGGKMETRTVVETKQGDLSRLIGFAENGLLLTRWGPNMQLTSPAYGQGDLIPRRFTCDGENISPEFSWRDAPKEAKSFVLTIHDPDAPGPEGFAHWVVYNIAPTVSSVAPAVSKEGVVTGLGMQGRNDSGKIGYTGPCPPSGRHRYFARLYALRDRLELQPGATYAEVMAAIQGKIIAVAELMGTYSRSHTI